MSEPVTYIRPDDGPVEIPLPGDGYDTNPSQFEGQLFVLNDRKWGFTFDGSEGGTVTWSFATANFGSQPSNVEFGSLVPEFFKDEIRAAFDAWEAVANINFIETTDSAGVDIRIGMGEFDGSGGTLGTAFQSFFANIGRNDTFEQVHIILDSDDYFSPSHSSELFLTATHEIGHAIGLGHEDNELSIMSSFINTSLTGLTQDDIDGAQAIYGPADGFVPGSIPDTPLSDDFFPSDFTTNGVLEVGGTVSGSIETNGDTDWFVVSVVEGHRYRFDLVESTLTNPVTGFRDVNGELLRIDTGSGPNGNPQVFYTAPETATVIFNVGTFDNETGTYTLSATDLGPIVSGVTVAEGASDVPNTTATSAAILPGDTFTGNLTSTGDQDWIAIELTPLTSYTFTVQGSASGGGTLEDPFLIIREDDGIFLKQNDDAGVGRDAQILLSVEHAGTYYLNVRTFGSDGGTYTITTSPVERVESDPLPAVIVPGITVTEGASDARGDTSTTDVIVSGDTFTGSLETPSDQDWISIQLTAGTQYTFDLQGEGTGAGTLADGFLVLRDSEGGFVEQDEDSGAGADARLMFTPTTSGTYFITARTFGSEGGTYALVTSPEERIAEDPVPDLNPLVPGVTITEGDTDTSGSTSTDVTIISGDTFTGELHSPSDQDWVSVDLTVGTVYTFDLQGAGAEAGTLADGFLVVRDSEGIFIQQEDGDGLGDDARLVFAPISTGTYFIAIQTFGGEGGTYSLVTSPEERREGDPAPPGSDSEPAPEPTPTVPGIVVAEGSEDAAGSIDTTVRLTSGDTFEGELDSTMDVDWVRIELTAGTEYTFGLQGSTSNMGTLDDPFLVLRDANGVFIDQDDDSGDGLNAEIVFTPTSSGIYYLSAQNFNDETGTYTLVTSPEERTADDSASTSSQAVQTTHGEGYVSAVESQALGLEVDQMRFDAL